MSRPFPIEIRRFEGPVFKEVVTVNAYYAAPPWVVHEALEGGWCATHLPSGSRAPVSPTFEMACALADALALQPEWNELRDPGPVLVYPWRDEEEEAFYERLYKQALYKCVWRNNKESKS